MATYCTPADVRSVLARDTTATEGTAASMGDPALAEAIGQAQAEVDAKLAARWAVPFSEPPELVVQVTRDIAAYLADLTYRQSADLTDMDPVWLRYQRALKLLDQLAAGAADLPGVQPPTVAGGGMVGVNPYVGDLFDLDTFGLRTEGTRVRVDYPR